MSKAENLEKAGKGTIERFNIAELAPAVGAYKHITSTDYGTGRMLNISGMLALDKEGRVIGENCLEQTKQVIENIRTAIKNAASHYSLEIDDEDALSYITDTLVLLNDMANFSQVNQAYEECGMPLACRAAFAAKELPLEAKGVLIEIRANAFLPR